MASRMPLVTRANGLTLLRLLATPVLCAAISSGEAGLAAAVFWLAVATDLADGWVARRYHEDSPFGTLVDHAVDATFVASGTAALALAGQLPPALAPLIVLAFLQYALDSRLSGAGSVRGSALGRWNGIAYYAIVAVPVMRDALGLVWPARELVLALGWLLVVSTLASIALRLRRLRLARRARGWPA
jgi:phosphatidylglycerophosphate synthase